MFGQVIPRSFLWLVSIWAVLTIGIIGCGGDDDDNEWVGTWAIATLNGQSFEQVLTEDAEALGLAVDFSILVNSWTFNEDGTMEMEVGIRFKLTEQGLELSGQGSMNITGTYSLSGSTYRLKPIKAEGTGLFADAIPAVAPTDEGTGTWSREGNTLTLHDDDGSTLVFKKK